MRGRTIKFRVWDSQLETMFYSAGESINGFSLVSEGSFGRTYFHRERIHTDDFKLRTLEQGYVSGDLEQFTGLFEKDGKEIYEGDIVQFAFGTGIDFDNIRVVTAEVVFDLKLFAFMFKSRTKRYMMIDHNPGSLRVVGNIHQDREKWFGVAMAAPESS